MSTAATQVHDRIVQLTPVKHTRRKRPSFSPVKSVLQTPKARTQSESLPSRSTVLEPQEGLATSSLEFEEFSFWEENGTNMKPLRSPFLKTLAEYLQKRFNVSEIHECLPYLLLWCEGGIPGPDERPFSIAGAIAVWLNEGDPTPFDILIGDWGEMASLKLEADVAEDLRLFHMPKAHTLLRLVTRYFPDAIAISYVAHTVIVEFPPIDEAAWSEKIMKLWDGFSNSAVNLSYHNGPLASAELKRLKKPKPTSLANLIEDDSDYIKAEGCFYPGVMLAANEGNQISAGVLVEKEGEVRLTVAFHCWEEEYAEKSDKLGDEKSFIVTQGTTPVGYVSERIGETDIGLAALAQNVTFENRFLDIEGSAKALIESSHLAVGDEVLIDSYVTGRQRLRCLGRRVRLGDRREDLAGQSANLPGRGKYIALNQGIYATGAPEIHSTPKIRAGVCGSAVVRVKSEKSEILERGEVVGFMHWSDLRSKNDTSGRLLCFADAADELLDAGWQIKPIEKDAEVVAKEPDSERPLASAKRKGDDEDLSPTKKSRIDVV